MNDANATHLEEVGSSNGPVKRLIVLLHGYGASMDDWQSTEPRTRSYIHSKLPDSHCMALNGLEHCELGIGRQWFRMADLDLDAMRDRMQMENTLLEVIRSRMQCAVLPIMSEIRRKQKTLKLTNRETILVGFSQGGMMALYLTLIIEESPFLAAVSFSGLLINPEQCLNKRTPICLIHGEDDERIPIGTLKYAKDYVRMHGIQSVDHSIPNLGHGINREGLLHAINFIKGLSVARHATEKEATIDTR